MEDIREYRPISPIHAIAKIISKILALRLSPFMNDLISPCQSAFIKDPSIHDNYMYVRNVARKFHRSRTKALLLKLDISKAFDTVRWDYLILLMQRRGFPLRWSNWIAASLSTSSSRVLLNGIPLDPIPHGRGLRQGDPLSPLLFILAIDPLYRLLQEATDRGRLSRLAGRAARLRLPMCADNAVIFLKPTCTDVSNLKSIQMHFGQTTGLQTNLSKTSITPIACGNVDLDSILADFPVTRTAFPIKYFGLPLIVRRLRKIDFQPLVDKAAGKMSTWHGRNLTQAGRVCLTKSVLSSQPMYLLTTLKPTRETLEDVDHIRKCFLWAGGNELTGGKCKVNWTKSCLPKEHGD